MARRKNVTPGFAKIKDDTDLGMAILMVRYVNKKTEPVEIVRNLKEAKEIILGHGEKHYVCHPGYAIDGYELWARGTDGQYQKVPVAL